MLAGALAVAEPAGRSGRDLLVALHAGVEVACKINHAIDNRHYDGGFHATGTVNVFGVAAAVARLLDLDVERTARALGIAAEMRNRVLERFGRLEASRNARGSGLGLSLVAAVAHQHGARLALEDNRPGLRAALRFPAGSVLNSLEAAGQSG